MSSIASPCPPRTEGTFDRVHAQGAAAGFTFGSHRAQPDDLAIGKLLKRLEAPPGFEPGMEVLQTSALPLGDGADRDRCTLSGGLHLYRGSPVVSRPDEQGGRTSPDGGDTGPLTRPARPLAGGAYWNWSGKRDSNPRLRPWQGRTLPLSYSRLPARYAAPPRRPFRSPRTPIVPHGSKGNQGDGSRLERIPIDGDR